MTCKLCHKCVIINVLAVKALSLPLSKYKKFFQGVFHMRPLYWMDVKSRICRMIFYYQFMSPDMKVDFVLLLKSMYCLLSNHKLHRAPCFGLPDPMAETNNKYN